MLVNDGRTNADCFRNSPLKGSSLAKTLTSERFGAVKYLLGTNVIPEYAKARRDARVDAWLEQTAMDSLLVSAQKSL